MPSTISKIYQYADCSGAASWPCFASGARCRLISRIPTTWRQHLAPAPAYLPSPFANIFLPTYLPTRLLWPRHCLGLPALWPKHYLRPTWPLVKILPRLTWPMVKILPRLNWPLVKTLPRPTWPLVKTLPWSDPPSLQPKTWTPSIPTCHVTTPPCSAPVNPATNLHNLYHTK